MNKLKTLGLIEQTSATQANNGTQCFYDPIANCDYLSYESGYVRRAYNSQSWWGNRTHRTIYQLNKTQKGSWTSRVTGNTHECIERIMIAEPQDRFDRIAHCTVTYRNNLNKK